MKRREFLGGGIAALGIGVLPWKAWAEMAKHPLAGQTLPAWKKGVFRIATLYTGGSEATFLTFPDGTTALIDCGDIGAAIGVPRSRFTENALSTAMVFSLGNFRYYNGGDFSWHVKTPAGAFADIEDLLAPECPEVDVANANHHGHHSMTDALVKALRARVVLAGVWHQEHMNRPTMRRLAKATWPCLYAPGLFPAKHRQKDAAEPWLKDVAPESFTGAHAVIDVASDGKAYRLMMVSAADESRRILGAYDFSTK